MIGRLALDNLMVYVTDCHLREVKGAGEVELDLLSLNLPIWINMYLVYVYYNVR